MTAQSFDFQKEQGEDRDYKIKGHNGKYSFENGIIQTSSNNLLQKLLGRGEGWGEGGRHKEREALTENE